VATAVNFNLAPQKAVEFFRGKGLQASFAWQDMLHEEHDRAFTVAKMMDLDLLADVRAYVDRALSEGWARSRFIDELKPELMRRGWWGRAIMTDPATGEKRDVQLGSSRRLKTIYDVNLRTSYAAGHWQRIEENKRGAPYVMYSAILDNRTRPLHRAWNGKVLPADDPWWKTHTPPNGWNCRCTVIQLSKRDLERLGKSGPDQAPPAPTREWTNPRTGEVLQVPVGVDPGFGYAPGASRRASTLDLAHQKASAAPPDLGTAFVDAVVREQLPAWLENPEGKFPVMRLTDDAAQAIGAKDPVAVLSPENAKKNFRAHPELKAADYLRLPALGADPQLIVQVADERIVLMRLGEDWHLAAVKATQDRAETYVLSFRKTNRADVRAIVRRGKVIFGEWKE